MLEICYTLQDHLGLDSRDRILRMPWLQAPAVIGWFRPVVFLPVTALTGLSEEQLESVIAHELAHIQRFDPFVNVFQVCVETLLFYHPAVWWLNKRIRAEREHCCDETAVALCGNAVEYARALTLMEEWRERAGSRHGRQSRPAHRTHRPRARPEDSRRRNARHRIDCQRPVLDSGARRRKCAAGNGASTVGSRCLAVANDAASPLPGSAQPSAAPTAKPSPAHPQSSATPPRRIAFSYIDGMKSVGLTDLSLDTLIAMKVQDVTPEYVRELQAQGLHPDAEKLIAMKVQDVTPEYVRELASSWIQSRARTN